jgi:hypothetical protein
LFYSLALISSYCSFVIQGSSWQSLTFDADPHSLPGRILRLQKLPPEELLSVSVRMLGVFCARKRMGLSTVPYFAAPFLAFCAILRHDMTQSAPAYDSPTDLQ